MASTLVSKWSKLLSTTQSPLGRSSHSISIIKNNLYLFGGENKPREPIDGQMHIFDLQTSKWQTSVQSTGEAPSPRVGHATAAIGENVYLFGGRTGAEMNPLSDLYQYNTSTNHWTRLSPTGDIPPARSYFSMTASKDHIYIFGGCPTTGRLSDFYRLTPPTTQTPTPHFTSLPSHPSISPRGGAGLAHLNNKIYLHGGFNGSELADLWVFDIPTSTWSQIDVTPAPGGRSVHGLIGLEERGVLVSLYGERGPSAQGHAGSGVYWDDVWVYEEGKGWREVKAKGEEGKPSGRGWFPVAEWEGKVVVSGGFTGLERDDGVYVLEVV
ncbi:hypothetical protein HDV00_004627 [Rhizophlyctis rosea]|nr:hypothetical protein HDV00_004627 [Rhizophlyctis rosea]